jgi:lipopolysaccharide transport system ATP-binding protein
MPNIAIKFENISKQYRLGTIGTGTLSHDLKRWWIMNVQGKDDPYLKIGEVNDRASRGESDYVWALRDISLEVEQGEVLGIIGKNGAGKSTLLKILSRVTSPSTGQILTRGRIASLLEVGTGFHTEMTGRENIFMNGAILGMTKAEIRRKFDEIVDFSGVERYIDTPVKRYSSGMMVRLGFAIAAHLEPEIIVVDEVLAVGDAEFQKKALGKMQDVSRNEGRTVLFVSHNMASIKTLCNSGIVLDNGVVSYSGNIDECVDFYLKDQFFKSGNILESAIYESNLIRINEFYINDSTSNIVFVSPEESILRFNISGILLNPMYLAFEAKLYDNNGILLGMYSPGHVLGIVNRFDIGDFELEYKIKMPMNMTKGEFFLKIDLSQPNVEYLVRFTRQIKILSSGIIGSTGLSFDYNGCGFLMLT